MRGFVFPLVAVVASLVSLPASAHAAPTWAAPRTAEPGPPPPATTAAPGRSDQLRMGTPQAQPAPAPPPQGGSPQPGGYPPPYHPGYPVYPPPAYGYDPQHLMMYEQQKKDVIISLVLEFLIPGLGSFYAGHPVGAAITWGLTLGGFALAFIWIADVQDSFNDDLNDGTSSSHGPNPALLLGAMGLILSGRIYGLYDAYASTKDYNGALATRLGLPPGFALGVTPIKSGHQLAWAPSLTLRF